MNLKTLTEQRADKQNEMETLLNKVEGEKRAFTEEENGSMTLTFAKSEKDKIDSGTYYLHLLI